MKGKIALITGGTRGIGRAVAVKLASLGADVALFYAGNRQAAEETLAEVQALGVRAAAFQCDVSDGEAVTRAVSEARSARPLRHPGQQCGDHAGRPFNAHARGGLPAGD